MGQRSESNPTLTAMSRFRRGLSIGSIVAADELVLHETGMILGKRRYRKLDDLNPFGKSIYDNPTYREGTGERIKTMKYLLSIVLLCALVSSAAGQQSSDSGNMSCVERLDLPMYPRLADAARISARVVTAIRVGNGGTVDAITSEVKAAGAVKTAFLKSIEDAVRSSRFAAACAGWTVTIQLQFSLGEQVGTERVSFAYPNRFTIFAPTKVIQGYNR